MIIWLENSGQAWYNQTQTIGKHVMYAIIDDIVLIITFIIIHIMHSTAMIRLCELFWAYCANYYEHRMDTIMLIIMNILCIILWSYYAYYDEHIMEMVMCVWLRILCIVYDYIMDMIMHLLWSYSIVIVMIIACALLCLLWCP